MRSTKFLFAVCILGTVCALFVHSQEDKAEYADFDKALPALQTENVVLPNHTTEIVTGAPVIECSHDFMLIQYVNPLKEDADVFDGVGLYCCRKCLEYRKKKCPKSALMKTKK